MDHLRYDLLQPRLKRNDLAALQTSAPRAKVLYLLASKQYVGELVNKIGRVLLCPNQFTKLHTHIENPEQTLPLPIKVTID